jgi:integrase
MHNRWCLRWCLSEWRGSSIPKKSRELGALEVKRAKHPGKSPHPFLLPVGGVDGLYLVIRDSGAKAWKLRLMVGGRRRHVGIGAYPEVGLAEARERAARIRDGVREGVDPVLEKRKVASALRASQGRALTFADAVDRFLEDKGPGFRNPKHRDQWRSTLDNIAGPVLGTMFVADVTTADVVRVLEPIWLTKTETATRLRGRIERVLAWAEVKGYRSGDNPAAWRGRLAELLPAPGKVAKADNHPALALGDVAEWFAAVRAREGTSARALELAALTAARSGEVRGMEWREVDLERAVWTVPAGRMKAGKEHRTPLGPEALALLRALPRGEGAALVFPAPKGGPLSDMALTAVMRRIHAAREGGFLDPRSGRPAVPHGLRSCFRDWCAETGVDRDVAELALAHVVGSSVERAYRRSDMFERRRAVMVRWAGFLRADSGSRVVALR